MKILVDAFGGDNAPSEIVKGAIDALNCEDGFTLGLTGKKAEIENELKKYSYDGGRVEIIDAPDVITCEEEPTLAIRQKPNSSLCAAFKLLKDGEADAMVSAGSSGALLVGATLKVGRIRGVNRPALCPILPTVKDGKRVLLLDAGANADCKPINLVQFAVMGAVYAEVVLGVKSPRVALLSNGTEDKKGSQLTRDVFPIISGIEGLNFAGNTEAREIMSGDYDVIVADGFSGNVALKSMEGAINGLFGIMKSEIYSSVKGKIAGLMLKKTFKRIKGKLDYNNFGGAVFLGADKVVVKAHGSSKNIAIKNSVLQAVEAVRGNINGKIADKLAEINFEGLNL